MPRSDDAEVATIEGRDFVASSCSAVVIAEASTVPIRDVAVHEVLD